MAIKSSKLQLAEKITRLAPNFQVSKALLSHTSVNPLNTNLVKTLTRLCPQTRLSITVAAVRLIQEIYCAL